MRKLKQAVIIVLCLLLPASISLGWEHGLLSEFDEATVYIPRLEEALDARYGSRDAWPEQLIAFLAIARYFGGLDDVYTSTLAWAPAWLQQMEAAAIAEAANGLDSMPAFLGELRKPIGQGEPNDRFGRAWPYEAHALITAAYAYSGHISSSYYAALPSEGDLPEEAAIAIAREAIQKQYELSDEEIGQYPVYTFFCVQDIFGTPFWNVTIGLNDLGYEHYFVYIASPTGEILVASRNDGSG